MSQLKILNEVLTEECFSIRKIQIYYNWLIWLLLISFSFESNYWESMTAWASHFYICLNCLVVSWAGQHWGLWASWISGLALTSVTNSERVKHEEKLGVNVITLISSRFCLQFVNQKVGQLTLSVDKVTDQTSRPYSPPPLCILKQKDNRKLIMEISSIITDSDQPTPHPTVTHLLPIWLARFLNEFIFFQMAFPFEFYNII